MQEEESRKFCSSFCPIPFLMGRKTGGVDKRIKNVVYYFYLCEDAKIYQPYFDDSKETPEVLFCLHHSRTTGQVPAGNAALPRSGTDAKSALLPLPLPFAFSRRWVH